MSRQTQAIIHLDKIKQNYQLANQWAPNSKNIAIIKADAYGHGLLKVATYLQPHVAAFGVAIIDEALALRQAGITKNILVLQGVNEAEELQAASDADLWLTIHHPSQVDLVLSTQLKKPIKLWLKLDSGMHRLGILPQQYRKAIEDLLACAWVDPALVLSSHFSSAGDLTSSTSAQQLEVFNQLIESQAGCQNLERSLANSAALASIIESHTDWNRPGIMLYGLPLFEQSHSSDKALQAAMTFNTRVIAIRQLKKGEFVGYSRRWQPKKNSSIATLAVGLC
ncbi:MAG: alanine racemase [Enterobacterales bacterium]|nr:alanine racemase [Enterobacterales bacterium]